METIQMYTEHVLGGIDTLSLFHSCYKPKLLISILCIHEAARLSSIAPMLFPIIPIPLCEVTMLFGMILTGWYGFSDAMKPIP
eukprot:766683-Hanusia_phi.AAC.4